jgi:hypothetical protein
MDNVEQLALPAEINFLDIKAGASLEISKTLYLAF